MGPLRALSRSTFAAITALVVCLSSGADAQYLTVTTFAGQAGGAEDGPGATALFASPMDVAVHDGSIYVADYANHTIRKISSAGLVTTFAGLARTIGTADATGSEARFNNPLSLATDSSGNVYVADNTNRTIRKSTPAGAVTTLAGLPGAVGSADGTGSEARFQQPRAVTTDRNGNVFVVDINHVIRKITPAGVVTTLAGLADVPGSADGNGSAARFNYPSAIAADSNGNLYVADAVNHTIRKITPAGEVTTVAGLAGAYGWEDGNGQDARFYYPAGIAVDESDNIYVAASNTVRKITPDGEVTTLAGLALYSGYVDANGSEARFIDPRGLATDSDSNVYIADSNMIRKITPGGSVSTVAGRPGGAGSTDGTGSAARFWWPSGIGVDGIGSVFVADSVTSTIRKISPAGEVITFAGVTFGVGSTDGVGTAARFRRPEGLAAGSDGWVYVADTENSTIRRISPDGTVSTLAGLALNTGSTDAMTGASARFNEPAGVAVDGSGFVYVADTGNSTIRKITPFGVVSTLAGSALNPGSANGNGSIARFNHPEGVATDAGGNVYVADTDNNTIRKITPAGSVTTLAGQPGTSGSSDGSGSAARFNSPRGIATDAAGNLYVSDAASTIRKITPAGLVTTIAGVAGKFGSTDGTGTAARLSFPAGVAVGSDGRVYIAEFGNAVIRLGLPALPDTATIDVSNGSLLVPRQLDTAPQTATQWSWSVVRRPAGSTNDLSAPSTRNPTFVPDTSGLFTFRLLATAASVSSITTVDLTVPAPPPVDLGPPASFSATAAGSAQVTLTWAPVSGATYYEIFRSSNGGAFVLHNSCPNASCIDALVAPDTTYLYKVRAMDDGGPSSFSAVDAATTTAFSDHPLSIGTYLKANHLLELRAAANAMRAAAGLSSATFSTTVAPGAAIQSAAITELRSAVDEARAAIGLPAISYVDATLTPQVTLTKAAHVAQLREAVE